jgi:tRNA (guanine37-N1)-methyltransferase
MRIDVITIFPDYFAPLSLSLLGKARDKGVLSVAIHDLRQFSDDPHRRVDDAPYGGGPGMVMRPEPWGRALDSVGAGTPAPLLLVPTPAGRPLRQADVARFAGVPWLVIACGRYEGIDARVATDARRRMSVEEVSIGDYVLPGGESAALVIIEAVTRLLPGVVGNEASLADDSFTCGLLEGPAYTRPPSWRGLSVPDALRSGDHAAVARWRREAALSRTSEIRPDLLRAEDPEAADRRFVGKRLSPSADDVAE